MTTVIRLPVRDGINEPFLTKTQLSQILGMSVRWIDLHRAKSGLPWHQVGGAVRFRLSEVEAWIGGR